MGPVFHWRGKVALVIFSLAFLAASTLVADVEVQPLARKKYQVLFTYQAPVKVQSVHLAGSFNSWSRTRHPMVYDSQEGVWKKKLILPAGRHSYKFVINGQKWIPDPGHNRREKDGFGGYNSLLHLTSPTPKMPLAKRGDGKILASALKHHPLEDKFPQGVIYQDRDDDGTAILRLRTQAGDIEKVDLCSLQPRLRETMKVVLVRDGYDYYEVRVKIKGDFKYLFCLSDGEKERFYGSQGLTEKEGDPFVYSHKKFSFFQTPSWVREAVFYQIFPERFRNGDKSNDPKDVQSWGGKPTYYNFFGGDLNGVIEKMAYLENLGINAIYFNPIFKAPSSHKYDTTDYFQVEPHFGGNETFEKLIKILDQKKMRFVLDGVFNHTGVEFFAFKDILKNQEKSKYLNWYFIKEFPVEVKDKPPYESWWGFKHLPQLNPKNEETKEYLMKVGLHWLEKGADGWRLDVPNEIHHGFWKDFRQKIKKNHPQAYIFGEIWKDAQPWLEGDEFDSVMNYPFRDGAVKFFAQGKMTAAEFQKELAYQRLVYPQAALRAQFNMLSNHDVPRFFTVARESENRVRLAVLFQMTYLGVPSIYYGEEIGMKGKKDPYNRRCFPWEKEKWNEDLRSFYQELIRIRLTYSEFTRGTYEDIEASGGKELLVFARRQGEKVSYVLLHCGQGSAKWTIALTEEEKEHRRWKDLLSSREFEAKEGQLTGELKSWEYLILRPAKGE